MSQLCTDMHCLATHLESDDAQSFHQWVCLLQKVYIIANTARYSDYLCLPYLDFQLFTEVLQNI